MPLLITIDRAAGGITRQLEQHLRRLIQDGVLKAGTALPPSRVLAEELAMSRGRVVAVYDQLIAEGYLVARQGSGTRVAERSARTPRPRISPSRQPRAPHDAGIRYDFRPGSPDVRLFPASNWIRGCQRALERNRSVLDYPHPAGIPTAREAVAEYLDRSRATVTRGHDILLCSGFAQGIRIMTDVLRAKGITRLGVEDPGYLIRSGILTGSGTEIVPIPLDADGLRVDLLARANVDAVLVTPAHHYPTGVSLSTERRAALLAWAAAGRRWILEDDYDSEYRYDRSPVGALQGLAPDTVVHLGTASKMLAAGLRLGWLIVPRTLMPLAMQMKQRADSGSPVLEQLALAEFIRSGQLDTHLRRSRVVYRRRQRALMEALHAAFPEAVIGGIAAGLHVTTPLAPHLDEDTVIRQCARRGVRIWGAQPYHADPRTAAPGLVIGFGAIDVDDIAPGIACVAEATRS